MPETTHTTPENSLNASTELKWEELTPEQRTMVGDRLEEIEADRIALLELMGATDDQVDQKILDKSRENEAHHRGLNELRTPLKVNTDTRSDDL